MNSPTANGDPRSHWCRHYITAHVNITCQAGLQYARMGRPLPCYRSSARWGQCAQFAEYTRAELDEREREARGAAVAWFTALNDGVCPHCGTPITSQVKTGRCVYAHPCGHVLYQGNPV